MKDIKNILIPVIFKHRIGIKQGKNSEVFLAEEINIKREIVIKKIDKNHLKNGYFEEARYLYQSKHPNIVEMTYAGMSDCTSFIYLAMPYYKNGSLQSKIEKNKKDLTIRNILRYSLNFLSGLNNIHKKKLIHLDIKPDNILLSDNNEAMLSDFGLVSKMFMGNVFSKKSLFIMTIPPENIKIDNGDIVTKSAYGVYSDIYQVGVTLYALVNLISLDDYAKHKNITTLHDLVELITSGNLYDIKNYKSGVPLELQKIINKCLTIDPKNRYKTIQSLLNDLGEIDLGD